MIVVLVKICVQNAGTNKVKAGFHPGHMSSESPNCTQKSTTNEDTESKLNHIVKIAR